MTSRFVIKKICNTCVKKYATTTEQNANKVILKGYFIQNQKLEAEMIAKIDLCVLALVQVCVICVFLCARSSKQW